VNTQTPAISWPPSARSCIESTYGTCGDPGMRCVARLPGAQGPCIGRAGDWACPAAPSPYTQKTLRYDGSTMDSRGCSANGCGCGTGTGATCACAGGNPPPPCGAGIHWYTNCGGGFLALAAPGACVSFMDPAQNTDQLWGVIRAGIQPTNPGSCPASGAGTPTGTVTPSGPATVCCVP
jgi:hypothetical protein